MASRSTRCFAEFRYSWSLVSPALGAVANSPVQSMATSSRAKLFVTIDPPRENRSAASTRKNAGRSHRSLATLCPCQAGAAGDAGECWPAAPFKIGSRRWKSSLAGRIDHVDLDVPIRLARAGAELQAVADFALDLGDGLVPRVRALTSTWPASRLSCWASQPPGSRVIVQVIRIY